MGKTGDRRQDPVTTPPCSKETHKSALEGPYRNRWHVEVNRRTISSTLGMEDGQPSPWPSRTRGPSAGLQLIWLMMAQAALRMTRCRASSKFQHTLQLRGSLASAWPHLPHDETRYGLFVLIVNNGKRPARPHRTQSHQATAKTLPAAHQTTRDRQHPQIRVPTPELRSAIRVEIVYVGLRESTVSTWCVGDGPLLLGYAGSVGCACPIPRRHVQWRRCSALTRISSWQAVVTFPDGG